MATNYKTLLSRAMSEYCARNIWNETRKEDRINIDPMVVKMSITYNRFVFGGKTFSLPTQEPFYIFASTKIFTGSYDRFARDTWINCAEINNAHNVLIHAYGLDGTMLPKGSVYIYSPSDSNAVFIAINAIVYTNILGDSQDLRLTRYVDSDNLDCFVRSYIATTTSITNAAYTDAVAVKASYPHGLTVYVNGKVTTNLLDIIDATYIDIVEDRDVIDSFDVNISYGDFGYYSSKDQANKLIIHIPKSINPLNKLITHNTCSMFVMDRFTKQGRYLHRCAKDGVTQLTHNDFAIREDVFDAFVSDIDSADTYVHVQVRTHSKDNVLVEDSHYIRYLYNETDEKIMGHLRGQVSALLPFWTADSLESGIYVQTMMNMTEISTEDGYDFYLDALGYYATANLMCNHTRTYKIPDTFRGALRIPKPYVLYGKNVIPIIYLNGYKVRKENVSYIQSNDNTVGITLRNVVYAPGDILNVALYTGDKPNVERITPSVDNRVFVFNTDKIKVYREDAIDAVTTISTTNSIGYTPLEQVPGTISTMDNGDGTLTVEFGPSLYGVTLVIIQNEYSTDYVLDLSEQIDSGDPLHINLTVVANDLTIVPILNMTASDVFFNGRYMTKDIDYFVLVREVNGAILGTQIVLTNSEYYSPDKDNILEVVAHTTEHLAVVQGYALQDVLANTGNIIQWYNGLSSAYINGKIDLSVKDYGTYMTRPNTPEGSVYEINTRVPEVVHNLLTDEEVYIDQTLVKINEYFGNIPLPGPDYTFVTGQYTVYSPFIATIIRDLTSGLLIATNDPNQNTFLAQFDKYSYLRTTDVTTKTNRTKIDIKFVDIRNHYRDMGYNDPDIYKIIQRLYNLYIGES